MCTRAKRGWARGIRFSTRAMTVASGLRNRIAHAYAYATLDVDRLWRELPEGLDALDRFSEAVARFVGPG